MFQLVFSLFMSWKVLDFQHFDIKAENMFMRDLPENIEEVCYFWFRGETCRCFGADTVQHKLTVLGDFGFSMIGSCREGALCLRHEDMPYMDMDLVPLAETFEDQIAHH